MNKFNFKVKNMQLVFNSRTHEALYHEFLKRIEKEKSEVSVSRIKPKVSEDLRGFYFGAVLPVVRKTCNEWTNLPSAELHQVMKKMFCYFETFNPVTKRIERFGQPVMSDNEWTNTGKAMQFLMDISDYLVGCGLEMPDSEDYLKQLDSARLINE